MDLGYSRQFHTHAHYTLSNINEINGKKNLSFVYLSVLLGNKRSVRTSHFG